MSSQVNCITPVQILMNVRRLHETIQAFALKIVTASTHWVLTDVHVLKVTYWSMAHVNVSKTFV